MYICIIVFLHLIESIQHRLEPSEDDRKELEILLARCVFHPFTFQILSFYQFLGFHGATEGKPFVDNDLIFCIEASRYKVNSF